MDRRFEGTRQCLGTTVLWESNNEEPAAVEQRPRRLRVANLLKRKGDRSTAMLEDDIRRQLCCQSASANATGEVLILG